ncbi:hypothetical protein [Nocardia veterana]|uniref:Uncharacterized protein n=1 Tax=Nocardia veterana TaxID=132249 RepID=A0A7X6RG46_9NOCA|nr:hypothetical protein [Nocardia veterana]NKY84248.1 hypothetical protein [Nocardia veterana]
MTNENSTSAPREPHPNRTRMRVVFSRPGVMTVRFDQAPVPTEERR